MKRYMYYGRECTLKELQTKCKEFVTIDTLRMRIKRMKSVEAAVEYCSLKGLKLHIEEQKAEAKKIREQLEGMKNEDSD